MKKWKMAAVIVLCLFAATVIFNRSEVSAYAYTQDEIDAAKAWLSANGYSPTRAGAEQAYQDYLNGKFGPVGGEEEETTTIPETETVPAETVVEPVVAETAEADAETGISKKTAKKNKEAATETETEETTEESSEETTETETNTESDRETGTTGTVNGENSTADMISETGEADSLAESEETVSGAVSETEVENGLIRVGRFDGIIVVLAAVVCAVAGFFTYRYIKKR